MGLLGSGSGPLGSAGEAQRKYKVSLPDAIKMSGDWYRNILGKLGDPADVAHFAHDIQEAGSHTAFLNFTKAANDSGNGQLLAQNAPAYKASTGLDPWQPSKDQPQFDGTNYTHEASDGL